MNFRLFRLTASEYITMPLILLYCFAIGSCFAKKNGDYILQYQTISELPFPSFSISSQKADFK